MSHTPNAKKNPYKQIALALSLFMIIVWGILGTGTSLAWFIDTTPELNNIFHFGEFDLKVSHLYDGDWEEVDSQTKIFSEVALYEPGYVQVVYLKIENKGTLPFELSTAVKANSYAVATNVLGQEFMLQDYLKFGIKITDTEEEMANSVPNRASAVEIADMPLHNYDTETAVLEAGDIQYIALIVHMPEEIGNVANYRGDTLPTVDLGITVKADQIRKTTT